MNKEYLEAQAAKQAAREQMAAARGLDGETAEALLAAGQRRRPKKRARRGEQGGRGAASSAAEAVEGELRRNRQLSSRINYDVVSLLAQSVPEDAAAMPGGGEGGGGGLSVPLGSLAPPRSPREEERFSETLSEGASRGSPGYY
ncbi:hypothetical protein EMIHUDRAFT_443983 [Emiliania huxleyi CCMP1516]|uniref:Brf1 TBP-binding domain-containing protein n=3 Tax=Emiliania huxleyi TaxID=2903 RepID=A0A0D3JJS2_EMIH1|nr:hypothetical protein EMIHUDRAFT_443983 [Emiliania huxleyi CCMP1516]EOD23757.1 hypothetical protein EMIHUDRAFT_443983 [Emiliania huxleyi CCMP1516]|eukprot:XP_005776186.1 hypothetical protein EMIHUDRAFT_443983 [Emiliania huxleyi CCMP1516]